MKSIMTDRNRARVVRPRLAAFLITLVGLLAISLLSPTVLAQTPTLTITSPSNNAVIGNGSPVIVTFVVSDFFLVQPGRVGQVVSSSEGHVDVYVDGQYARLITRVEPIPLALDSGPHTIRLELNATDGSPPSPAMTDSVTAIVTHGPAGGDPGIEIVYPSEDARTGHDVYVAVVLSNFTLVDPNGRPNAPNEGHLQVLVQGQYEEELSRYEPAFVVDMADGFNTITVRLVNNDGTPLDPDVFANTTIFIPAATTTLPQILNFGVTVLLVYILIVLVLRRRRAAAKLASSRDENP